VSTTLWE